MAGSFRISRWCWWLMLVALLLRPVSIYAKRTAEFDTHVEQAEQHISAERYEQAIVEYQIAYALKPEAWLLINIGRAHFRAHRPREALQLYDQALKGKLTQGERVEVLASARKAQRELDEQRERDAAEQRRVVAEQQAAQEARLRAMEAGQRPPSEKPVYKRAWFWGIIGGAAATGLVVGLGFGLRPMESSPGPTDVIR